MARTLSWAALVLGIAIVVLALTVMNNSTSSNSEAKQGTSSSATGNSARENEPFSYADYGASLSAHVDDSGMVSYKALKAGSQKLDAFTAALANLDPQTFDGWSEEEKIAFWVNAYNALTLKAIIDHYPIKASFFKSVVYPKNSIRQIDGVWDKLKFQVQGRAMTLDEIEHQVLRAEFDEPRIHMALVCAAMGCPPLRSELYTGDQLDAQLDDQTRKFLANPEKFRIDRDRKKVYLSPIFKWFGEDFVETYGIEKGFSGKKQSERAVLNFIAKYLDEKDREYLSTAEYEVSYLDYDWSLNEQT